MCMYVLYVYLSAWPLAECTAVDPLSGDCWVLVNRTKLPVLQTVGVCQCVCECVCVCM